MTDSSSAKRRGWIVAIAVLAIAGGLITLLSSNFTAWASNGAEQKTDDAYLRADVTPLSTKAAGLVASVEVSDYQHVTAGQLLARLHDEDFRAQVDLDGRWWETGFTSEFPFFVSGGTALCTVHIWFKNSVGWREARTKWGVLRAGKCRQVVGRIRDKNILQWRRRLVTDKDRISRTRVFQATTLAKRVYGIINDGQLRSRVLPTDLVFGCFR